MVRRTTFSRTVALLRFGLPMLVASALILAACGGGDSGSDPGEGPSAQSAVEAGDSRADPGLSSSGEPAVAATPGEGVTVQPARANWDTGYFQEAVYSKALEALGYEVLDFLELDPESFYRAVGSDEVDFWANGWFPLHDEFLEQVAEDAAVVGTVAGFGALQGYLVDKAAAEQFNITSLEDLKRPEVKAAFDRDGDGKADLSPACEDGWACAIVIDFQLDALGLREHVNAVTDSYTASMEETLARFQSGEHILFYAWTPHWSLALLRPGEDVVWIEVPGAVHPLGYREEELAIPGVDGCVSDPCIMGFEANDIQVVANNAFLANNPAAAKLFEVMAIPLGDIARQNSRMQAGENTQADIETHAEEWIVLNRDLFDSWLGQARAAAV